MSAKSLFLNSIQPLVRSGGSVTIMPRQSHEKGLQIDGGGGVKIAVVGPQMVLEDTEVDSVYPTPGSTDSPADYLPHIALKRRTLPWERSGPSGANVWMALLLVRDSELLLTSGLAEAQVPISQIAARDSQGSAVLIKTVSDQTRPYPFLFLDRAFFRKICPSQEEQPLLCSVKRTLADDGTLTDRAIVIGNRLPTASATPERHTAYLVSLENRSDAFLSVGGAIALPVLYKWSFSPSDKADFEQAVRSIHVRPNGGVLRFGNLPAPLPAGQTGPLGSNFDSLLDEHGLFLTPLDHVQQGQVSFRSPLRPFSPPPRSKGFAARSAPEELTGVGVDMPMDYSHAIAFELGRMIALGSKDTLEDLRNVTTKIDIRPPKEVVMVNELPLILQKKWLVDPPPDFMSDPWQFATNPGEQQLNVLKSQTQLQNVAAPADITGVATQLAQLAAITNQTLTQNQLGAATQIGQINLQTVSAADLQVAFPTVGAQIQIQIQGQP